MIDSKHPFFLLLTPGLPGVVVDHQKIGASGDGQAWLHPDRVGVLRSVCPPLMSARGRPLAALSPLPTCSRPAYSHICHPDIKEKTHFLGNVFNKRKLQKKKILKAPLPLCAPSSSLPPLLPPILRCTGRLPFYLGFDDFSFCSWGFGVPPRVISHSHPPPGLLSVVTRPETH